MIQNLTRILKMNFNEKTHAAIDKLPENYKSVIILRDIQGLDYEQIVTSLAYLWVQ